VRQNALGVGVSVGVVSETTSRAKAAGVGWEEAE
jgi:hypothetical protein